MTLDIFAATGLALYAAHHVGDYWVQSHHQAMHKGDAGWAGRAACFWHVFTYVLTQYLMLLGALIICGVDLQQRWAPTLGIFGALIFSGLAHYAADRREHGLVFWLAQAMPWKRGFWHLGAPRGHMILGHLDHDPTMERISVDNPSLGTGAWALDQSWHIATSVFIPALIIAATF